MLPLLLVDVTIAAAVGYPAGTLLAFGLLWPLPCAVGVVVGYAISTEPKPC